MVIEQAENNLSLGYKMTEPLALFEATVARVQNMADGSPRFTFDAGEEAIPLASVLMQAKVDGVYLQIMIYDQKELEKELNGTK